MHDLVPSKVCVELYAYSVSVHSEYSKHVEFILGRHTAEKYAEAQLKCV